MDTEYIKPKMVTIKFDAQEIFASSFDVQLTQDEADDYYDAL